jgi:long-chain fatty acid transport protein
MNNKKKLAILIGMLTSSSLTLAGTFGTDLNNNLLPATGGMGGASVARTVEPAAAVFGNPATLTEYNKGTSFTFGATYFDPKVRLSAVEGGPLVGSFVPEGFDKESRTDPYLVPTVAITQAFSEKLVVGMGVTVQSGIGSDFRESGLVGDPIGELVMFNANLGVGYKVTENLSLGATATLGNGYFQASLSGDTASTHAFGARGTLGVKYDMGATSFGAYYKTELVLEYDDYIAKGDGTFWSDDVAQPEEFAVGIANNSLMGGNLQINADIIHKNWSSANFYKDFYRDQTVFALGAQLTTGPAQWRIGYSHARDPIKRNLPQSFTQNIGIGNNDQIGLANEPFGVSGPVVEYFQATNAGAVWEDTITVGMGYQLMPNIKADVHAAYTIEKDQDIGSLNVEASAWQAGVGLTWHFE